jgi:hypothetical protein
MTRRDLLIRYLHASADYHEAHGGIVIVARATADEFVLPRRMRYWEARYRAMGLAVPCYLEDAA